MGYTNKSIYFASDFHLGFEDPILSSKEREDFIIGWLESIQENVEELYLLGDIFDYWYEYANVIPKGNSNFLSKIREFRRQGIPVYFFTGNHDLWMKDYFTNEFGIPIYRDAITKNIKGKIFHLGHGDGLGPGDLKYKAMKKVFRNPLSQWLFSRLHPNLALSMMKYFSKRSRMGEGDVHHFLGEDKEWLIQYGKAYLSQQKADYLIFGHRHIPIDYKFEGSNCRYVNLGEWLTQRSYAQFDGENLMLKFYKNENAKVYP